MNLYTYAENNPINYVDPLGLSRDTYVPDRGRHGGPHVDRYTPEGKNVGRYRPDGTPVKHMKKTPPPIPKKDLSKFWKAAKKLGRYGTVITAVILEMLEANEAGAGSDVEPEPKPEFK